MTNRITKFAALIAARKTYKIPLRFLVDLGLESQPIKLHMKIICMLETKMNRLFESNKQVLALPSTEPNAKIIYHVAPYIQYEQIRLNELHKQYLKTVLLSEKVYRTRLEKSLLKKFYKLASDSQFHTINLDTVNRQFYCQEISLVFDKSNQNASTFDSYNAELTSRILGAVKVENITNKYSVANELEFDLRNKDQKHQIYSLQWLFSSTIYQLHS